MHTVSVAPKQVATVNITGIVNAYVKNLAKANVDPNAASEDIKQFAAQLQSNIQILSKKKGVVILPSEAVIAGAKDLTPALIKRMPSITNLEELMKNEQSQVQQMKQTSQTNQSNQNNQAQAVGQVQSIQPTESTKQADQLGVE
jgi:hypothetical protein